MSDGLLKEDLKEALLRCHEFQPNAIKTIRKNGFVFRGKGGKWEKLAFTFYTDLCEIHWICKNVLEIEPQEARDDVLA